MTADWQCGRPTATTGRPCRAPLAVWPGDGWWQPKSPRPHSCVNHLTPEELEAHTRARLDVAARDVVAEAEWLTAAPACWAWALPPEDSNRDLDNWQAGRCAVCAYALGELVTDHDHRTGLVRGLLCRSCNTREGMGANGPIARYRERPPAAILGLTIRYFDPYLRDYAQPRPEQTDGPPLDLGL